MEREHLKELRPLIPEAFTEQALEIEAFQNAVLRPVIKFQHELICAHVSGWAHFSDLKLNKGPRNEFQLKVRHFISKQADLKNQLIGFIAGMLTLEEYTFYLFHHQELNKRIVGMISQRVSDTYY
jgi:hypothetical protein